MLADFEIRKAIEENWVDVKPFDDTRLNPVSLDLTLDDAYRRYRDDVHTIETADHAIDPGTYHSGRVPSWHSHTTGHTIPRGTGLLLRPGDFVLGCTTEYVSLSPSMAARVEGKSSLGRLGVAVHITAGFIDPGFRGQITLEIVNLSPAAVTLHVGMPICQIVFEPVSAPERDYSQTGHYLDQRGPTESRYRFRR
jgi:dCTP deaminase